MGTIEKVLKVCNTPQGKKYVPSVRIAGDYLSKFNFKIDDNVIIKVEDNIITIKKAQNKDLLEFLCRKNKNLNNFVDGLGLEII
ncbi:MAG: hypothetical protein WCK02_02020 [Bacteroidota bacterium]